MTYFEDSINLVNLLSLDFLWHCTVADFADLIKRGLNPNKMYNFTICSPREIRCLDDIYVPMCASLFKVFCNSERDWNGLRNATILEIEHSPHNPGERNIIAWGLDYNLYIEPSDYLDRIKETDSPYQIDREIGNLLSQGHDDGLYLDHELLESKRVAKIKLMLDSGLVDLDEENYLKSVWSIKSLDTLNMLIEYGCDATKDPNIITEYIFKNSVITEFFESEVGHIINVIKVLMSVGGVQLPRDALLKFLRYVNGEIYGQSYIEINRIIEFLLESGIDINYQDEVGETALIKICREAKVNLHYLDVLIRNGADLNLVNLKGDTAMTIATHTDVVKRLTEAAYV